MRRRWSSLPLDVKLALVLLAPLAELYALAITLCLIPAALIYLAFEELWIPYVNDPLFTVHKWLWDRNKQ